MFSLWRQNSLRLKEKTNLEKRNNVFTVKKISRNATILKAAEKLGDEWALKIKERISENNTDLAALDARYHRFYHTKL